MSPHSRRAFCRLGAVAGLVASAGCVTSLTDTASAGVNAGRSVETLAYREGFEARVATLRSRYGPAGVWGLDTGPSLGPGVEYVGAWRDSTAVPEEREGEETPFATLDAAALVYRLDGPSESDGGDATDPEYRVWLWAGSRPHQREGRLGRSNVTRLSVGAEAAEGWSLRAFAPRGPTREGPVRVSLDERGPSARTPLPGGGIAPDTGREGPGGRVEVAWQGVSGETRSVNAVCAFVPDRDTPFEVTLSAGIAAARGVL